MIPNSDSTEHPSTSALLDPSPKTRTLGPPTAVRVNHRTITASAVHVIDPPIRNQPL